jgi:glyoxylate/hydroxypyruvate reductase
LLDEKGAIFSTFENLLKESDFVILTLAYTPESKDLLDEKAFKLMKKSSILINPSRGAVINQDHLVSALKDGSIFGAGLDVMTPEPLPTDHPLISLPNCTMVPHLGSATIETRALMGVMTVENITGVLENTKMPAEFII